MANKAYLLLGTNLGNRQENLTVALRCLSEEAGVIIQQSSVYETSPWGVSDQPDYWNQVLLLETALNPFELLQCVNRIEREMGRMRRTRWESRTIDIDILYYNELVLLTDDLIIPHPAMAGRRFTLVPLAEIAPAFIHPVLKTTNQLLLNRCPDQLTVAPVLAVGSEQ
jgi:2-amino-4-hydroxy-6-hydroxymethyldihydropteridine diphosphokinase